MALQRLAEDPDGLPYLTAQDRQICACILREQERTWYNGQERTLYRLDQDRALLAAAGHPRLVRAETHAAVELVRGAPTLAAERRTKDILVRIEPFPPEGRTLLPVEESPQRIRLVEFDARHRQIARILGPEGLRVPKGGEERLVAGLTAVAPLLTVHSDIAGPEGGAESVPADPRPHLHLSPLDERPGPGAACPPLRRIRARSSAPVRVGRPSWPSATARRCAAPGTWRRSSRPPGGCWSAAPPCYGGAAGSWTLDDLDLALGALEQLHALGEAVVLDWPAGQAHRADPGGPGGPDAGRHPAAGGLAGDRRGA